MADSFNHQKIEKKWSKKWLTTGVYEPDLSAKSGPASGGKKAKKPFYNLMMFPYPSAEGLHIGGVRTFTGVDIYGRFKRMQGYDVFEPIGLDGFGIHSENYALKAHKHPIQHAKESEKNFYRQLGYIGNGFAWKEKLETYDPAYYKWTQWIFTEMFRRGLAYRKKQPVNWCPSCKTVLADEQVISGKCERCGTIVEKRDLEQWFFKITHYAEKLLENIDKLDWSDVVRIAQRNWIGKSEGAEIDFEIKMKEKPNFVLLHGKHGSSRKDFFPWLKKDLEKYGYKVQLPDLPDTDEPDAEKQASFVLKKVKFDKNTVIVGHSFGARVALRVLEKKQVTRTIFVAGRATPGDLRPETLAKDKKLNWKYNFTKIRKNAGSVLILHDSHDPIVPREKADELQKFLGGQIIDVVAEGTHFNSKFEPTILDAVLPKIKIFTTRPDTLFGATYMVLAPEHKLIQNLKPRIKNWAAVQRYIKNASNKSEAERITEGKAKTGVELKGIKAINPATKKVIPIWVADYVLSSYGTGAIMAVPAHDERDFEFAKKFKLPIIQVILKRDAPIKSYLMGGKDISDFDLAQLKIRIFGKNKDGDRTIEIPKESIEAYERLIIEKMTPGFWNEYIGDQIVFIFKYKNNKIQRFILGVDTESGIDKLAHKFISIKNWDNECVWRWLAENKWYTDVIIHSEYGELINSGTFDDLDSEAAKWEITKFVGGKKQTQYHLRDWLISRQRYWGPPIPMIYCEACAKNKKGEQKEMPGWYAVPEKNLPVKLPYVKNFRPQGEGHSPLASVKSFYEVKCPACKNKARRETDVSDTFLDSAWYFLRYPSVREKERAWNPEITKKWLPVTSYIGGAEHSVLHLLYARFLALAFKDFGYLGFEEPFTRFRAHGLITKDGAKMSKSKGNVVNPDEYFDKFGADVMRMYLAFLAPFEQGGDFRDSGILGLSRFVERVWRLGQTISAKSEAQKNTKEITRIINKTIKKVGEDIEVLHYNTAISALMVLINEFEKNPVDVSVSFWENFLKLLAPFAPFIAEELWEGLGHKESIHLEKWPVYDSNLIKEDNFELVIQVNGKVKDRITAPAGISRYEAEKMALASEKIKSLGVDKNKIKKVIFVPDRLINIVI